tara:strand:+ start:96 stop:290 length:195 start_codon:yes stop_codon:yes gene_type:complete
MSLKEIPRIFSALKSEVNIYLEAQDKFQNHFYFALKQAKGIKLWQISSSLSKCKLINTMETSFR